MYALIAAAGRSARMGVSKALLPFFGGRSFVRHLALTFRQGGIDRVVVTVAPDETGARVRRHLTGEHLTVLDNRHMAEGLMGSLRTATEHATGPLLFCPVDAPFVDVRAVRWLVEALRRGAPSVRLMVPGGFGHPAGLSATSAAKVAALAEAGETPRALFDEDTALVEWPDANAARNVNAPEDYIALFGHAPRAVGPR